MSLVVNKKYEGVVFVSDKTENRMIMLLIKNECEVKMIHIKYNIPKT